MPIDQARGNRAAARINDTVGIALFEANNYAVFNQQAIVVGNGLIQITLSTKGQYYGSKCVRLRVHLWVRQPLISP
jgi:hypothetical protein